MTTLKDRIGLTTDPVQKKAAESKEGPLLLQGGPGTGKTHTLLARMKFLISRGALPQNITYITISSRGAESIRDQLRRLKETSEAEPHIFVGTILSYASMFLRRTGAHILNISPSYTIWDHQQTLTFISETMDYFANELKRGKKDHQDYIPKLATSQVMDILQWHGLNLARHNQTPYPANDESWYKIIEFYQNEKLRQNVLDLDDLVPMAIKAMERSKDAQLMWSRTRSMHLLIDEFQDITPAQYELINLMTGPTKSIMVASDPNQSVFRWNGADSKLQERFIYHHNTAPRHILRANHRSVGAITKTATHMTEHRLMTGLGPDLEGSIRNEGERPQVREYQGDVHFMDEQVIRMAQNFKDQGVEWEDMALLYRRRSTASRIGNTLFKSAIPNTILGEIQKQRDTDTFCLTKMLTLTLNPLDLNALSVAASIKRKPTGRRLSAKITMEIHRIAKEKGTHLIEAADQYIQAFDLDSDTRRELSYVVRTWTELCEMLDNPQTTLYNICKRAQTLLEEHQWPRPAVPEEEMSKMLSLAETNPRILEETPRAHLSRFIELLATSLYPEFRSQENDDPFKHNTGITLATIHVAKTAQWKIVWILDANEHIMPGPSKNEDALNEEQRTFYVASTRAADRLFYCYSTKIQNLHEPKPTRFIQAIEEMVDYVTIKDPNQPSQ